MWGREAIQNKMASTVLEELAREIQHELGEWEEDYLAGHWDRYLETIEIVETYHSEGTVVDVGAAPGHFAYLLSKKYDTVGVDLSPDRVSNTITNSVDIRQCDIEREELPLEDQAVSTVILSEVFEHLRINPIFTIQEINRVLEDDGILILTTSNIYGLFSR